MPVLALKASRTFWNASCSTPPHSEVTVIEPEASPDPSASSPPPPAAHADMSRETITSGMTTRRRRTMTHSHLCWLARLCLVATLSHRDPGGGGSGAGAAAAGGGQRVGGELEGGLPDQDLVAGAGPGLGQQVVDAGPAQATLQVGDGLGVAQVGHGHPALGAVAADPEPAGLAGD